MAGSDPGLSYREVPHNEEAEKAILGALLSDRDTKAYDAISDLLREEHFYFPIHKRIFAVVEKLNKRGQLSTAVQVSTYMKHDGTLKDIGGDGYLAGLVVRSSMGYEIRGYAELIIDLAKRRALIELCEERLSVAMSPEAGENTAELIESIETGLYSLAEGHGVAKGGALTMAEAMTEMVTDAEIAHKRNTGLAGVSTGLAALDHLMGGLAKTDLTIIGGRPAMGKTALAMGIAYHVAVNEQVPVNIYTLEMSASQIAGRMAATQIGFPADRLRRGGLSSEQFMRLVDVAREMSTAPVTIDETPSIAVELLHTRARRDQRQRGTGLIVVDYLQLLGAGEQYERQGLREKMTYISNALKAIAKDLKVPVIALSQLSRDVDKRDNKRPVLSDLRESGTLEQDADQVIFVFRESYYLDKEETPPRRANEKDDAYSIRISEWHNRKEDANGKAELIIAKQRHGPTGTAKVGFAPELTQFYDLEADKQTGLEL